MQMGEDEEVMKRAFIAAIIASLLLVPLVGILTIEVVKANPMVHPTSPNTELPTLKIHQPQNYSTTFVYNTLELNLDVNTPTSWNSYKQPYGFPEIADYWLFVYLDGTLNYSSYNSGLPDTFAYNYTVVFNNLTAELHSAKIELFVRAFYYITNPSLNYSTSYRDYKSNVTQTVLFQIDAKSQTIMFTESPAVITREPYPSLNPNPSLSASPSPSLTLSPSPSPTPTPTESPSESPTQTLQPSPTPNKAEDNFAPLAIAAGLVITVVVAGLLVHFKKIKK